MSGTRIPDGLEKSTGPAKSETSVKHAGKSNLPSKIPSPASVALSGRSRVAAIPPEKTAVTPGGQTVFAREIFKQTAAALGFPKDSLSIALLAFARFFSLSPDSSLLGMLRRETIASLKTSSPAGAKEKAVLEAEALAAVIAKDKGVILSPDALERYARFLMPPQADAPPCGESEFAETGEGQDNKEEREKDETPDRDKRSSREEVPAAEELQAIAGEQAKQDSLFDFLNSLPGKNGHYWMVFPFKIKVRGTELTVYLRILKKESVSSGEDGHLMADISAPKRQWRCFLKKTAGKLRADIRVYPECRPRELNHLLKEAKRCFGKGSGLTGDSGGFDEISVKNGEELPSWAEDLCGELLPSIDKEV